MKKAILILLVFAGFTAGAQNFNKEYFFWNSDYGGAQFVYSYADGYATVGIKKVGVNYSIALIRTDLNGDTLFTKTLIDTISGASLKRSGPDSDGCHYLTFAKSGSVCVARFSPDWDLQWIQRFNIDPYSISLTPTRDNNLLITGRSGNRLHLYCLTSSGNTIWEKSTVTQEAENPISILELENGEIIIPAETYFGYEMDYYGLTIYCFSATGEFLSNKSVPLNNIYSTARHIILNNDTLAVIYYNSTTQGHAFYLMHLRTDGSIISERELSLFDLDYFIYCSMLTPENHIVLAGIKVKVIPNTDFHRPFISKITFEGDNLWTAEYAENFETRVSDIQLCPDGGYIVSGNFGGTSDRTVYLIKTDSLGNLNNLGTGQQSIFDRVSVYPNPATEDVVFETDVIGKGFISITDILGRPVAGMPVTSGTTVWDVRQINIGIYFYRFQTNNFQGTGKIVISK